MNTLFGGEGLGTCVKSWIEQKARPNSLNTSPKNFVALNNQDPTILDNLIVF